MPDIMNSTALYDAARPLNTREASKYLSDRWRVKRAPSTLDTDRHYGDGRGPTPFYIGVNPFYWPADLDAWVQSRVGSASEARQIRLARQKLKQDESKPRKVDTGNSQPIKGYKSNAKRRKPPQKDYDDSKPK